MSFLFLCCCRPFLRDRTEQRQYYELLEVPQDASLDDIKRAYKRKSLALHPDKLAQRGETLTAEAQARFQRVKEAYEVLADPKRRRMYDDLGETGLRIIENPQSADMTVLGKNFLRSSTADRCALFSVVLAISGFVLLLPILLCLQTDKTISIPWTALWTPLWICDGFVFLVYLLAAAVGRRKPPEGLEEEFQDDFGERVLALLQFSCNLLFQIFLTLKLDKAVPWTWSKVFAPWLVWEGLQMLQNIRTGCQRLPTLEDFAAGMDPEMLLMRRIEIEGSRSGVLNGVLRVIFVALAILKLDGKLSGSWWGVFAPLWVYFGLHLLGICRDYTFAKARLAMLARPDVEGGGTGPQATEEQQIRDEAEMMATRACFSLCTSVFWVAVAVLAVARIQGANYSVFIIFIPLFIVVGCLTCVMGMGICCVSDAGMYEGEGTPLNPGGQGQGQGQGQGGAQDPRGSGSPSRPAGKPEGGAWASPKTKTGPASGGAQGPPVIILQPPAPAPAARPSLTRVEDVRVAVPSTAPGPPEDIDALD